MKGRLITALFATVGLSLASPAWAAFDCGMGFDGEGQIFTTDTLGYSTSIKADGRASFYLASGSGTKTFADCPNQTAMDAGTTSFAFTFKMYWTTLPSTGELIFFGLNTGSYQMQLRMTTGGKIYMYASPSGPNFNTTETSTTFTTGQWYTIGVFVAKAAGGAQRLYVNGQVDINTTHSGAIGTGYSGMQWTPGTESTFYVDSIGWWHDESTMDPPYTTFKTIGRQGVSTAPTYTNGTPTCTSCTATNCSGTCSTGTNCCALSEIPPGTSKYVTIETAGEATTKICDFSSASCTGMGSDAIGSTDVIYNCNVQIYAKRGSGGGPSSDCLGPASAGPHCMLWRYNGTDNGLSVTMGTSDTYFSSTRIATPTYANLATFEVGASKGTGTGRNITLEDVFLECSYAATTTTTTTLAGARRVMIIGQTHDLTDVLWDLFRGWFAPTNAEATEVRRN